MTDIEIANSIKPRPIIEIAKKLGVKEEDLELYGKYKAKVSNVNVNPKGKLILEKVRKKHFIGKLKKNLV